jgi:hypothetical protein
MGLETGSNISDLNSSNPTTGDNASQGDDHLRLVKAVLKTEFPSFVSSTTGVVATQAELSVLGSVTAGVVTASKAVVVDASQKVDEWNVDNVTINLNTISTTNTNGDLVVSPNGTGDVDFNACSIMIDTGESIKDAGGDPYITFTESTTPVNHFGIESADTGVNVKLKALGEADSGIIYENDQSEELFIMECTASAVNEFTSNNAATGAGPSLSATGGDTNIDVNLIPKGSGAVNVQGAFVAGETTTGANAHAVAITGAIHEFTSSGADALTLADGTEGQHLYIICTTNAGGDATLTPSNLGGGTTLTFSTTDESCHLVFTNANWYLMGGNGVAIA